MTYAIWPGATCTALGGISENRPKPTSRRCKKTDTVSVSCFFSYHEGYSVFLPLCQTVFHAIRQDLFDARLAQHEAQEPQGNETEAHERGQTVADGMRATRMA